MKSESGDPIINPLFDSEALSRILAVIINQHRVPKFEDLQDEYNIQDYHIDKMGVDDVQEFYTHIVNKYKDRDVKRSWCENELRIFVWLVFHYAEAIGIKPDKLTNEHWSIISSVFFTKDLEDCKFELMSISKEPNSITPWSADEDRMLVEIIEKMNHQNKWNDIAKQLFKQSNEKFFRKPKQCRERWRNYLDPVLQKGQWKPQQDRKLLDLVLQLGKKWSGIAKHLKTRTEHAVKNRFRSLLKKYNKSSPGKSKARKKSTKDIEVVKRIIGEMDQTETSSKTQGLIIVEPNIPIIIEPSVKDIKDTKEREKQREDLERFYPVSPNSAFRYCDRRNEYYQPMIVLMSPRLLSPRMTTPNYKNNIDWNDSTRDAYFL